MIWATAAADTTLAVTEGSRPHDSVGPTGGTSSVTARTSDGPSAITDGPSERSSDERQTSVENSPITHTPLVMPIRKAAGQRPFAAGSRIATHSTWWVIGKISATDSAEKAQVEVTPLAYFPARRKRSVNKRPPPTKPSLPRSPGLQSSPRQPARPRRATSSSHPAPRDLRRRMASRRCSRPEGGSMRVSDRSVHPLVVNAP